MVLPSIPYSRVHCYWYSWPWLKNKGWYLRTLTLLNISWWLRNFHSIFWEFHPRYNYRKEGKEGGVTKRSGTLARWRPGPKKHASEEGGGFFESWILVIEPNNWNGSKLWVDLLPLPLVAHRARGRGHRCQVLVSTLWVLGFLSVLFHHIFVKLILSLVYNDLWYKLLL